MDRPLPRLLGDDTQVPCVDGRRRRYVNLDYAASTPVMAEVWEAVEAFLPWYSSVHRGSGYKSQVATDAFEGARGEVARFVGARRSDDVVFVRNTTEAVNVLAASLPAGHAGALHAGRAPREHAPVAPPRRRLLPFTRSADELLDAAERALRAERIDLVAVTGASNVTGEVWPLAELAALAHRHGAQLFVDAAQLAPHRPIDMAARGHRLARVLRPQALRAVRRGRARRPPRARGEPLLHGGGAIKLVTLDDVIWADAPERFEAGSPNVVGVVALARRLPARCARSAWTRSPSTSAGSPRGCGPGSRPFPACADLALWPRRRRPRRRRRVQRSTATATRCWRRSSAPSTRSACATAASAPTR